MTNKEIARLLKETSSLIELTGGNPFRARAFSGAARRIERMDESVAELVDAGTITEVDGIGDGLAGQIGEILQRGSFEARDSLLESVPDGLPLVLRVKGLGAKKVRTLWEVLGVESIRDLEEMARSGRIADLDGFGKKTEESILENLETLKSYLGKLHFADARRAADTWSDAIEESTGERPVAVGPLRRGLSVVDRLDLMIAVDEPSAFEPPDGFDEVDEPGPCPAFATDTAEGPRLTLFVAPRDREGSARFELTGPDAFTEAWSALHGEPEDHAEEDAVFDAAGVPALAAELRDLPDAAGRASDLAELDLVTDADLKGILHNHSTCSDGAHSLREMAEACRTRGYEYFGICDHSQSLKVANGLSPDEVRRQRDEVDSLNEEYAAGGHDFKVFFGIESDILQDGSLDYEDDVLELFDMIVASVHQGFNMTREEATERIVTAVANPFTAILGHPTGRLLLRREGYEIDHERVLEACAEHGVSVELNANPWRLDLDWRWIETAVGLGVPVSINPDAHSTDQLDLMKWGVVAARKGGLTAADCLNALSRSELESWLDNRR